MRISGKNLFNVLLRQGGLIILLQNRSFLVGVRFQSGQRP